MRILGVIPARYASTRFPAKVLADIHGKTMIKWVYEQASKAKLLADVVVATDHVLIKEEIEGFGGKVVMTGTHHKSGTDRCYEALVKYGQEFDYVLNIQGDEPFIKPEQIDECAELLDGKVELATQIAKIRDYDTLLNPSEVKVVIDKDGNALYFSRQPIPFVQGARDNEWLDKATFYKHVSLYAYRVDILEKITKLDQSYLEETESLEQLRWLENGFKIKAGITRYQTVAIDTKEDLDKALRLGIS